MRMERKKQPNERALEEEVEEEEEEEEEEVEEEEEAVEEEEVVEVVVLNKIPFMILVCFFTNSINKQYSKSVQLVISLSFWCYNQSGW